MHLGSAVKSASKIQAALGFRAHSGWAVLIAMARLPDSFAIADRRRVTLADPQIPGSKQPYHAAEAMPLARAKTYLNRCITRTQELAREAMHEVVDDLQRRGHDLVGCGILAAAGRPLPRLVEILASHPLLHTAEGELYRKVLINAAEECGLPVRRVPERELLSLAAAEIRMPIEKLRSRVLELGRTVGPPWGQDEKYAALVAWMWLAHPSHRIVRLPDRAR